MHRHDQDLIMALADGALTGAAGDEARREIEACDECRVELEQQRAALDWLRSADPVELSEIEAARLRRSLDEELGHVRTPAAAEITERKGVLERIAWGPMVAVAAVLVGVVFVAGNLSLVGGGDDAGADNVALESTATEVPTADLLVEGSGRASDGGALDESIPAAPEESADDEVASAATETTTVGADAAGEGFDLDQDLDTQLLSDVFAQLEDSLGDYRVLQRDLIDAQFYGFQLPVDIEPCLDESAAAYPGSIRQQILGVIDLPLAGPVQLIVHFGDDDEVLAVVAHDVTTCEPINLVESEE